ncbi:MAG: sugar phosphate isomerase/epimerase, partial [Clostridia bacterium]|nr:sugar phosphate isomerase/epimerase [Clostridia bacterium]
MKLSFSTLACPDFTWPEIYSMTKDFGLDGIEIRGLGDEISAVHAIPFTDAKIDSTIAKLHELNLVIPCLSSGCALKYKENEKANIEELEQYIVLAQRLGTPYVRVLADLEPQPMGEVDDPYVVNVLKKLSVKAKENGVVLLVESNGVYADTLRLRKLLDAVGNNHVAALWDVNHPYRFMHESPEKTVENLGNYIKYVHVKDSV